jgi:hypothetical protein
VSRFDSYRTSSPNARLIRSDNGALEVMLHTCGGTLVFNGNTREQFADLFHQSPATSTKWNSSVIFGP